MQTNALRCKKSFVDIVAGKADEMVERIARTAAIGPKLFGQRRLASIQLADLAQQAISQQKARNTSLLFTTRINAMRLAPLSLGVASSAISDNND
jgi:hypothetical protein